MSLIPKKIVGLDFHDYYAQVVELSSYGNKVSLSSFNRVAIPPQIIRDGEIINKDELRGIIRSLFDTANPQSIKSRKVVCSFPSKKIFTHIFKFPLVLEPKEIKKALPFEAETVIPFSINDVYWDFRVLYKDLPSEKHASQYVLFTCVQKSVADGYVSFLNSLGLTPFAFTIPSECAEHALKTQLKRAPASLVIDVGSLVTTYSYFKEADLKDVYSSLESGRSLISNIAQKSQMTEAEVIRQKEKNTFDKNSLQYVDEFAKRVFAEAKNFLGANDIKTVFITGEFLNLPNFYDLAKQAFPGKEVSFGDPRIGIAIDCNKFIPLDQKDGFIPYSIYFTQAFGLALKGLSTNDMGINLLPDYLRDSLSSKKLSLILAGSSILLTGLTMLTALNLTIGHQDLVYARIQTEAERNSMQQLIYGARYQEIKNAITDFNSEVSALTAVQNKLFSTPYLLDEVFKVIPNGITISSLEFSSDALSINISGVASDRDLLLNTQKNLEALPFVEKLIAPLSNFDQKTNISFLMRLNLKFSELKPYAYAGN